MAANRSWIDEALEAEEALQASTGTEVIIETEECIGGTGTFIEELPPRIFLSEQGGNNSMVRNWLVGTDWDKTSG